jgi:CrcB protein
MAATYFWVALGSALGGMARFWLTGAVAAWVGARFPWGTLLINILGSLVIGATAAIALPPARLALPTDARIFVMVGICGGFTTFSAFSLQTLELLQLGDASGAMGYITGSVALCLAAVWLGWWLARLHF